MIFWFVFSLTAALGVKCQLEREELKPGCLYEIPFPEKDLRVYVSSGKILPSSKFFEESCETLVENLKCVRDYQRNGSQETSVDYDSIVNNFVEFCDEESKLRKDYVTHFACFNSMNITEEACFSTFRQWAQELTEEMREILDQRNINRACLLVYLLRPCVVDNTNESCGTEAGQTVDDVLNRTAAIFSCNDEDADLFEEFKDELNSKLAQKTKSG